MHVVIDNQHT